MPSRDERRCRSAPADVLWYVVWPMNQFTRPSLATC